MHRTDEQVRSERYPAAYAGEQQLVGAARAGCDESFTALVDRYHGRVLHYLVRQTGDRELAADLTQDTFLDAFRRLERLQDDRPFLAWLYRIARYNLLQEWRRQRSRVFVSLDQLLAQTDRTQTVLQQPDKSARAGEQELIRETLDTLSPTLRDPIVLQGLYGFSSQEVAGILDITWDAARQRLARGKARFRAEYQRAERDEHTPAA